MSAHRAGRDELARTRWIKSSRSGSGGGNCVEVGGLAEGRCAVRDSKRPTGTVLIIGSAAWFAFTTGVCSGDFD
jgi:Domain of unknown function (DUF397)